MTHLLLATAAMVAVSHAAAQGRYPEKPIHLLVGFPAGSTADVAGRLIGQKWSEAMGKPVVVENIAGAAGNIALERVVKAAPDGYTLALAVNASSPHIAAELLKSAARLDIRHVPYKGVVAGVPDLLAGRITMMFAPSTVALPPVRSGKLRALAVTSLKRSAALPDVPTVAESGFPGFEATLWGGVVAPLGTPPSVIQKLHAESVSALAQADVRGRLAEAGLEAIGSSPAEFAAVIKSEIPKWAKLISETGMRPD